MSWTLTWQIILIGAFFTAYVTIVCAAISATIGKV
jgi:hypothetical protein